MAIENKLKIKQDYKYFCEISTRWNDNDVRWHVNNAKYYEFFDTVINKMLIDLRLKLNGQIFKHQLPPFKNQCHQHHKKA